MNGNWFLTRSIGGIVTYGPVTDEAAASLRTLLFREGAIGSMNRERDGGWTISTATEQMKLSRTRACAVAA